MDDFHESEHAGRRFLAIVCLLASIGTFLAGQANAGLRGPGKYSGVVLFDRWGGCILFSGVYLMYISETVKDQLRPYDGRAIELDALDVVQPTNPGDGLIRKLKVLGPAPPNNSPFTFDGIKLNAQPVAVEGSRTTIELTVANEGDTPAKINTSQIGFVLLSEKIAGAGNGSLLATTRINVRGQDYRVDIPLQLKRSDDELVASGEFKLQQSALGLTPFSVMMGALRVQDEMTVRFLLVAHRVRLQ